MSEAGTQGAPQGSHLDASGVHTEWFSGLLEGIDQALFPTVRTPGGGVLGICPCLTWLEFRKKVLTPQKEIYSPIVKGRPNRVVNREIARGLFAGPHPTSTWCHMEGDKVTGLALCFGRKGAHSDGLLLMQLLPIPVEAGRIPGDRGRERERQGGREAGGGGRR